MKPTRVKMLQVLEALGEPFAVKQHQGDAPWVQDRLGRVVFDSVDLLWNPKGHEHRRRLCALLAVAPTLLKLSATLASLPRDSKFAAEYAEPLEALSKVLDSVEVQL